MDAAFVPHTALFDRAVKDVLTAGCADRFAPGGSIGEIGGRESRFRDDRAFPWPPGPARLADVQPGIRLAPRRASSRA